MYKFIYIITTGVYKIRPYVLREISFVNILSIDFDAFFYAVLP
jgi:hypothetical protein